MHIEAHAALGWLIGNAAAGNSRRVRNWCVAAAVLPDVDAIPYVFGPEAYGRWHHTFGHNVFLMAVFSAAAGWHCCSWRGGLFTASAFGSHLLTDAFFSGWFLYLLWPLSHQGYLPVLHVGLEHPINVWFIYAGIVACLAIAFIRKRTPLDMFSPKLDALLISFFQKKPLRCAVCGQSGNRRCEQCGQPLCARHVRVTRRVDVRCPDCATEAADILR